MAFILVAVVYQEGPENIWQFLRQNHLGNRVFKSC
jgi:hypothetical protein